jgi:hypothetical protein
MGFGLAGQGLLGGLSHGGVNPPDPQVQANAALNRGLSELVYQRRLNPLARGHNQLSYGVIGGQSFVSTDAQIMRIMVTGQEKPKKSPKPKNVRQALQQETDEWLNGVFEG